MKPYFSQGTALVIMSVSPYYHVLSLVSNKRGRAMLSGDFAGSIVALITPMHDSGEIDFASFKNLIEWHIASGTNSLVVHGTTGESATLTLSEKIELLKTAVKVAAGRLKILAGTGSSSTATTIQETRAAASCGVDGALVVTPYYNRPTQQGLYEHYKAVAESTELPIFAYNVPGRTGCDMLPATLASLAYIKNIVGIKEATGDVQRVAAIQALAKDRFILLSGDDATTVDFIRQGGHGVISVTANVAPKAMQQMCSAALNGDFDVANEINDKLADLHCALMSESNPIPTKWLLRHLGKITGGVRLPLTTLAEPFHSMLITALQKIDWNVTESAVVNNLDAVG